MLKSDVDFKARSALVHLSAILTRSTDIFAALNEQIHIILLITYTIAYELVLLIYPKDTVLIAGT